MTVFETETMAELCVKQGHMAEGLAIYRRLIDAAPDATARARRAARLAELEQNACALRLERRGDDLVFTWKVPDDTPSPTLQVLLVARGPDGVETETRTLALDVPSGTTQLTAERLVSVHAALGRLEGARFVPLARLAP